MHRYKQFIEHFIMIISADKACTKLDETKILSAIKCIEKITVESLWFASHHAQWIPNSIYSVIYIFIIYMRTIILHSFENEIFFFTDRVPVEVASWKKNAISSRDHKTNFI